MSVSFRSVVLSYATTLFPRLKYIDYFILFTFKFTQIPMDVNYKQTE